MRSGRLTTTANSKGLRRSLRLGKGFSYGCLLPVIGLLAAVLVLAAPALAQTVTAIPPTATPVLVSITTPVPVLDASPRGFMEQPWWQGVAGIAQIVAVLGSAYVIWQTK